eukprot:6728144-Pyramimonas_sp.AAC.2
MRDLKKWQARRYIRVNVAGERSHWPPSQEYALSPRVMGHPGGAGERSRWSPSREYALSPRMIGHSGGAGGSPEPSRVRLEAPEVLTVAT